MNNEQLNTIISSLTNEIKGQLGYWHFAIDSVVLMCITDELHNRMRIISPIDKWENVSNQEKTRCLEANFHTALDVRYALSDGYIWSAFIHPLKELTEKQVLHAVSQVYSSVKTFRSSYSSGALIFPTRKDRDARNN